MLPGSRRGKARLSGARKSGPEPRDATVERREAGVPVTRYAAPQGADEERSAFSALRSPHTCEGKGKRGRTPRRPNNRGDESRLLEYACWHAGCLTSESGMEPAREARSSSVADRRGKHMGRYGEATEASIAYNRGTSRRRWGVSSVLV